MKKKVKCPHCGYEMPLLYDETAESRGIYAKCKGRNCGKEFEIVIREGQEQKEAK
ncbi:hypothetical protein [Pseudoflavonifractor capillosus]|jgi:transcription elongation factor Elf1|uniref:Uncharacterized protein n=1 Tax=Pseudoflavonifractor capillosus TaxID=106588 RepID=A0A921ST25_9FIRM|nr:hypothetical protein [Pseudoflavonifractor capillosus]HJG87455.1 hypothetical protein [Pseudoflavonifractor capillosus]